MVRRMASDAGERGTGTREWLRMPIAAIWVGERRVKGSKIVTGRGMIFPAVQSVK